MWQEEHSDLQEKKKKGINVPANSRKKRGATLKRTHICQ